VKDEDIDSSPQNLTQYFSEHPSLLAIPQSDIDNLSPVRPNQSVDLSKLIAEVDSGQPFDIGLDINQSANPLSLTDLIAENENALAVAKESTPSPKFKAEQTEIRSPPINLSQLLNENQSHNIPVDAMQLKSNSFK
jgi:hypothetical protein